MLKVKERISFTVCARAICSGVLLCLSISTFAEQELEGLQAEINRQETQIQSRRSELNELQNALETHDKRVAGYSQQIREAQLQQQSLTAEITSLTKQIDELETVQERQREQLEALIVQLYRQSRHQPLSDLLGSEDRTLLDRMQVYTTYLNQAKIEALEELAATETELSLSRHQLSAQQGEQKALITTLSEKRTALANSKQDQRDTVAAITKQLSQDQRYLQELESNQQRLIDEIAQAQAATKRAEEQAAQQSRPQTSTPIQHDVSLDGLSGKLDWPIEGRTLHQFGSAQSGQLRWKGMVIAGNAGDEVKAVADGQVVFAEWLRGYGLLIMLDHGKDTMTLYGYNQTLLRNVGDTVLAGEAVALVGNSGGQSQNALYFQIRDKGQPIDPRKWLK
uniref:peptidoglycan DD-metalloendopeptidase family protein n=1 Tax=Thaumasiovibrio occultus TaxID=1891184 RepID=UPI000B363C1E|nr:peptidoglycan DD-metalloendopeptidase family protein [Thaumasiovibrio occultus]